MSEAMSWEERIGHALEASDRELLLAICDEVESCLLDYDDFPDELFETLLTAIQSPAFLRMEGSYGLIRIFEHYEDDLSQAQKQRLLRVFEKIYPLCENSMGQFVISEQLAQLSTGEDALTVWQGFLHLNDEVKRSFVAHGLEHLVRKTGDAGVRRQAYEALLGLQKDPSDRVRREAMLSLDRIARDQDIGPLT